MICGVDRLERRMEKGSSGVSGEDKLQKMLSDKFLGTA